MADAPTFDPVAILEALTQRGVRFVVIGGIAALSHGSPLPTEDVDITPERDDENLERLAAAEAIPPRSGANARDDQPVAPAS